MELDSDAILIPRPGLFDDEPLARVWRLMET
jgi:hypothetical protein